MTSHMPQAVRTGAYFLDQCSAPNQLASLILELIGDTPGDGPWSHSKVPLRHALDDIFTKEGIVAQASCSPNAIVVQVPTIPLEWLQESWELDAFHEGWGSVEAFSSEQTTSARTVVMQAVCGDGFAFKLTMDFEIDTIQHSARIEWMEGEQHAVEQQVSAWISEFRGAAHRTAFDAIGTLPKAMHGPVLADLRSALAVRQVATGEDALLAIERLIGQMGADDQPCLDASEKQLILGILDRGRERAGLVLPSLPPVDGQFWNLRQMIRGSEFPTEDSNPERIYLKLEPFDIGIKREADGVVVDIWGHDEVGLESLGSTFAFFAEAEADEETSNT